MQEISGPFGRAIHIETLPTRVIAEMYRAKCGFDVDAAFIRFEKYRSIRMRANGLPFFWRPESIAGNESFYRGS